MMKKNTKFVYTLSSKGSMVSEAITSICTLKRKVDPSKIFVIYTPPYDPKDERFIRSTGVNIIKSKNQTQAFSMFGTDEPSHYGEKIKITDIECENLVFLDCDTVVTGNIWRVLDGDFDIKARPGTTGTEDQEWEDLFDRFNEEYLDFMPNTGFLVFKNKSHRDIGDSWLSYVNASLDYDRGVLHKEQYALALAAGHKNWEKMTMEEHVFGWEESLEPETVVYHRNTDNSSSLSAYLADWARSKARYVMQLIRAIG
jgi:hypothetical protein